MTKKTDSTLSAQAHNLQKELKTLGVDAPLCKVLEALSRSKGFRTLHVAQAQKPLTDEEVALKKLALRLASRVFFKSTGRWEGKELTLMSAIDNVFAEEASQGSAYVEAELAKLLEDGKPVEVNAAFEGLQVAEWKAAFDALVQANMTELGVAVAAPSELYQPGTVYCGRSYDWRLAEQELEPSHPDAKPWDVAIATNGDQFYVDFVQKTKENEEDYPAHCVMLEINNGIPVVRISSDTNGDVLLNIHITKDGLYMTPNFGDERWLTGAPPENSPLHRIYQEEAFLPEYISGHESGNPIFVGHNHRHFLIR